MPQIPIGSVGVVVSYVGKEHVDVSGDAFKHGDLVERGGKGVWVEPLLPGKHPLNLRVMKVELVPTTNIVLNWAERTEAHAYDNNLSSILVRSKDGFSFSLDVAQVIHIGAKNAPRVISRVGSMQNLVDHVLQPTVGNYFRNSAQEVTVLEFLSARSERQRQAKEAIRHALEAYDVECIDTLIGDIVPPAELMKTQTDRKIADELKRTYDVQRESQEKRQQLERERAVADLQAEVVRSEQMVRIAEQNAHAIAEAAKGEAAATRLRADAEADATRALGAARADAYRQGQAAIGPAAYSAMQIATIVGERGIKIVPDISARRRGRRPGRGADRPHARRRRRQRRFRRRWRRQRRLGEATARPGLTPARDRRAARRLPRHPAAASWRARSHPGSCASPRPTRPSSRAAPAALPPAAASAASSATAPARRPPAADRSAAPRSRARPPARSPSPSPARRPAAAAARRPALPAQHPARQIRQQQLVPARLCTSASKITLRSSRMLPGHEYAHSAASAAGVAPSTLCRPSPPAPPCRIAARSG